MSTAVDPQDDPNGWMDVLEADPLMMAWADGRAGRDDPKLHDFYDLHTCRPGQPMPEEQSMFFRLWHPGDYKALFCGVCRTSWERVV